MLSPCASGMLGHQTLTERVPPTISLRRIKIQRMALGLPLQPSGHAPGAPGIAPTWTSSAKDIIGCSLGAARLWFTMGFGIVNEVYYPRVDIPQTRDLGFIVAGPDGFWSEVKRNENYQVKLLAPGVPAVEALHEHPRYSLRLRVTPDPRRDVLLIECLLDGDDGLGLYALLAPHLGATGRNNTASIAQYRGRRVLWADQGPFGAALAAVDTQQRDGFGRASAGYVGTSDGWQDFRRNGAMTRQYHTAGPGNVALIGELPRRAVLALGFGSSAEAAATLAISSAVQPFENVLQHQIADWEAWQARGNERGVPLLDLPDSIRDEFLVSTIALRARISTRPIQARWWPASACPGVIPAKSAAGIIWSGRAIWSNAPARFWRSAPSRRRETRCAT